MTIDLTSCTRLLRLFNAASSLPNGKQIHLLLVKSGHLSSAAISNCLLQMYTRCNPTHLSDAHKLFDEIPHPNAFSSNTLIDAYFNTNNPKAALTLFNSLPDKNPYSWNTTIIGLIRCGDLTKAQNMLNEMPVKDPIALNAVIHGIYRCGQSEEALRMYKKFGSVCTDGFVLATVVSACAECKDVELGRLAHGRIVVGEIELDSVLGSALVNMYAKCGDLDTAVRVFELMVEKDDYSLSALVSGYASCGRLTDARSLFDRRDSRGGVVWNSMITGYVFNHKEEEALVLFKKMWEERVRLDSSTLASVLTACTNFGRHGSGKQLHACATKLGIIGDIVAASALMDSYSKSGIWEDAGRVFAELKVHDTVSLNSMINVYSNCGRIEDARHLFESIPSKSLISWNSMIVGYSQNGQPIEALGLFYEMHRLDLRLDKVSLASALSACAYICDLKLGEQIFALVMVAGFECDPIILTSLIDFYCKCGSVTYGRKLFDGMDKSDVALWNSMLMGYASSGYGTEMRELYKAMKNASVRQNEITFISILSGCCHCGMLEEGLRWFREMKEVYGIDPVVEHYSCMVELLVRAGRLEEAICFIDRTPFEADVSMLTSILGGCKAHGDEALGFKVAARLMELNPHQSGPYVQLSSIYAAQEEWERSAEVRGMMHDRRIQKNPAYSWID